VVGLPDFASGGSLLPIGRTTARLRRVPSLALAPSPSLRHDESCRRLPSGAAPAGFASGDLPVVWAGRDPPRRGPARPGPSPSMRSYFFDANLVVWSEAGELVVEDDGGGLLMHAQPGATRCTTASSRCSVATAPASARPSPEPGSASSSRATGVEEVTAERAH